MYELIEHKKLDAAAASITFSNIPQTYTDLMLLVSARNSANVGAATLTFNTSGGTYERRRAYGSGSQIYSDTGATDFEIGYSSFTASTFSNASIYVSNYTSSAAKSYSSKSVSENNGTEAYQMLIAGSWSGTDAISSITLKTYLDSGNFVQHSSATLYGINRTQALGAPKAIGGNITYANGYWVHTFTGSGTFYAQEDLEVDALVVAGGGAGGNRVNSGDGGGGGGGAGGMLMLNNLSLAKDSSAPIIVGAGGVKNFITFGGRGLNGADSEAFGYKALGGGGGAGGIGGSSAIIVSPAAGTANTGGGGGGGMNYSPFGAAGGSGVVIVRYKA